MVKAYYIGRDRFRICSLDGDALKVTHSAWESVGGKTEDGPVGAIDLVEGSMERFDLLVKNLAENDRTADVAQAVSGRLESARVNNWKLPLANGEFLEVGGKPLIMGIVNITPDSFSDGGRFYDADKAVEQGKMLADEGADILDIGGESTRPGAEIVDIEEESRRVLPVIEKLAGEVDVPISIDTRKPEVAERAIDAGAAFINDATMLTYDPDLAKVAARANCAIVLNHIRGTPGDMQRDPHYDDLLPEVIDDLDAAADKAIERGVDSGSIVLDPGIGFGKTLDHNLRIIKGLHALASCGKPVLVGPSRKRFINDVLDLPPDQRLEGTIAACVAMLLNGAAIFRVHDVQPHRRALDIAWAIYKA